MNTIEITSVLSHNNVTKKKFKGVFACNQLPLNETVKKPFLCVANTQPSYMEGQHWIAIYIPLRGKAEFFDSFNNGEPKNRYFKKFLQMNSKEDTAFLINTQKLQGDYSSVCGFYCCMYTYWRSKGCSLKSFIKMFSKTNFNSNDAKITKMYNKFFNEPQMLASQKQKGGKLNTFIQNQLCLNQKCKPRKIRKNLNK